MTEKRIFSTPEKLQGYALEDNKVIFLYDPKAYLYVPSFVSVHGEFNDWNNNNDPKWRLEQNEDEIWTLEVDNQELKTITPDTEFKFKSNGIHWNHPTKQMYNQRNWNLVFVPKDIFPTVQAHLINRNTIWAKIEGIRPLLPEDYRVITKDGQQVKVAAALPNTAHETLIKTEEDLDLKRVYFLEISKYKVRAFCDFELLFNKMYSPKVMGAETTEDNTVFRIFSPRSTQVLLNLYQTKDQKEKPREVIEMIEDKDGVWEYKYPKNLHGMYYDFIVHGHDDPGNHFYGTTPVKISDPYARVNDDAWGRSRVWNATTPPVPLEMGIPPMEDIIAYEVHVQDFTEQLPIDEKYKGTLKGMTIEGLRNERGEKVGFDYLVDLGINVLHLMPVQEFLHAKDEDWYESFKDDEFMIEQGIAHENYQWGYRTTHAFAVENKYRVKGSENGTEREDLRDLVQKFHEHGIAVIIDIVPNHTAENMNQEVEQWHFNFNVLDKLYYYRTRNFEHLGEYGNEVKTENRPMVQKWLIDQCLHFINEFGIDGFRIDLAGQIDKQTLKLLKDSIGSDKILYGEPWIHSNDPNYENNPSWDWYKIDSPITFFQDDARNAFKGETGALNNKETDRGWAGGNAALREDVIKALTNTFYEERSPLSGINYLDIHDNHALADQFATENWDGRLAVDQPEFKIAALLLFTSLGPIVMHGGTEIMRSKALAGFNEMVKETKTNFKVYIKGQHDTYNLRKPNEFIWSTVGQKPEGDNKNDYDNMYKFWRGLIAFRKSKYGSHFRVPHRVPTHYFQWILPEHNGLLGYVVNTCVLVLINSTKEIQKFKSFEIPKGFWRLIGNSKEINHHHGIQIEDSSMIMFGGMIKEEIIPALDFRIYVRERNMSDEEEE